MKFLFRCLLFCSSFVHQADFLYAQSDAIYRDYVDYTKFVVRFNSNISDHQIDQKLFEFESIGQWKQLSFPDIVVVQSLCKDTDCYYDLCSSVAQLDAVEHVGVFFKAQKGVGRAVLSSVLVMLRKSDDYSKLLALQQKYQLKSIKKQRTEGIYLLECSKNTLVSVLDLAIELNESGAFVYAEPNYLISPMVHSNDSLYARQWAHKNEGTSLQYSGTIDADMDIEEAWTISDGSASIEIAVLDSGVDTLHPDLVDNMLTGYSAVGDSSKGYPSFNFSNDGHGTCCAGILAAKANNNIGVAGIAPSCKIIPVKVFTYQDIPFIGTAPYTTAAAMADAISWSWQVGRADVMSNSWGVTDLVLPLLPGPGDTSTVNAAIDMAYKWGRYGKGCPMLFSSGNDGDPPIWPSNIAQAIAVNATSMCDERKFNGSCDGESWEGNYGNNLELAAPGVKITTTDAVGTNGYNNGDYSLAFNGTSAACPNAAGVMALILSVDSSLSVQQARQIIDTTAEKVGGYNYDSLAVYGGWSNELGYGRVNAYKAVMAAQKNTAVPALMESGMFLMYPNPTDDMLTIQVPFNRDLKYMQVFNSIGQCVRQQIIQQRTELHLSLAALPSGTYCIKLFSEKQVYMGLVIKG